MTVTDPFSAAAKVSKNVSYFRSLWRPSVDPIINPSKTRVRTDLSKNPRVFLPKQLRTFFYYTHIQQMDLEN